MRIKSMILRGTKNVIVLSPHRSDREMCRRLKIRAFNSIDYIRGLNNKHIYINENFKHEYYKYFNYISLHNHITFFQELL